MAEPAAVLARLLERHGRTFAAEAGIRLGDNSPSPLFQLLCLALLVSARIRAGVAMAAARAVFDQGWTTPQRMLGASWEERTHTLNRAGYARYDESTARYLEAAARLVLDRYDGDLRRMRRAANGSIDSLLERLTEFTGIGEVGAAFFVREVQDVWDEFAPFCDDRAARSARALGLPEDPAVLAASSSPTPFAVVVAALVRADIAGDLEEIRGSGS